MPKHCRLCLEVGHNRATCLRRLAADIELKEKELADLRDEYMRRACAKEGLDKEDEAKHKAKQAASIKLPAASQSNEKQSKAENCQRVTAGMSGRAPRQLLNAAPNSRCGVKPACVLVVGLIYPPRAIHEAGYWAKRFSHAKLIPCGSAIRQNIRFGWAGGGGLG